MVGDDVDHRVARQQGEDLVDVVRPEHPQLTGPTRIDRVAHERSPVVAQPTETVAPPEPAASSIVSAMRMASSISVSTICDSGTVLITSPLTKI